MDLLRLLTHKEVTLQYKRTTLGIFWSLLNPLLLALVFYIAFTVILGVQITEFPLFLLSALFPWTWFSNSVSALTVSFVNNRSLVTKIPFPKHFLLIAGVISQGIHFLFSIPIIVLLVYFYGRSMDPVWLIGIPLLSLIQFVMTLGASMAVSTINVYFRDFQFIVAFLLNLFFWMTPIIYQLEAVPEAYRSLFMYLNPMTSLISLWRTLFMSNTLDLGWLGIATLGSLITFSGGILVFRRLTKRMDEVL